MSEIIYDGSNLAWECCMSMLTQDEYYQGLEHAAAAEATQKPGDQGVG